MHLPFRVDGRKALVTGGASGIGEATCRSLCAAGAQVTIADVDRPRAEALSRELPGASVLILDITDEAAVESAFAGIEALDILVNNAGIMLDGRKGNETTTTSKDVLQKTFNTNFFAVVGLTQALLPLLKKSLGGRIVNLSSILGSNTLHATPGSFIYDAKTFAYDASKSALNAFTIHLAHELKDTKIKVNSAHPGWVKTEMGGEGAQLDIETGAKTSVELATLQDSGPNGAFLHLGKPLPW